MACLVCFAVSQKIPSKASTSSKATLRQLSNYLFANYKKDVRPVWNWRKTTNVAIDVMLYAILSVVGAVSSLGKPPYFWLPGIPGWGTGHRPHHGLGRV